MSRGKYPPIFTSARLLLYILLILHSSLEFHRFSLKADHGQRGMKRGAAEKMRVPRRAWSKKIARADHHDILEKRRLGNADADSRRASESRRSDAVEF